MKGEGAAYFSVGVQYIADLAVRRLRRELANRGPVF